MRWLGNRQPWLVTSHGTLRYDRPAYRDHDIFIFGSETAGLPQKWLHRWPDRSVYIPIMGNVRNYNLSNTVSIILAHASLKAGTYDRR